MARRKPYKLWLAFADLFLLCISLGGWGFVMVVRELYQRQ